MLDNISERNIIRCFSSSAGFKLLSAALLFLLPSAIFFTLYGVAKTKEANTMLSYHKFCAVVMVAAVMLVMVGARDALPQNEKARTQFTGEWWLGTETLSAKHGRAFASQWDHLLISERKEVKKFFLLGRDVGKNVGTKELVPVLRSLSSDVDVVAKAYPKNADSQAALRKWIDRFHRRAENKNSPLAKMSAERLMKNWFVAKIARNIQLKMCIFPKCPRPPPPPPQN